MKALFLTTETFTNTIQKLHINLLQSSANE
ncbi:MAG: hypothetical protein ACI8ZM_004813 [Crocinitomix sp.]|jgi:hypothetical protein